MRRLRDHEFFYISLGRPTDGTGVSVDFAAFSLRSESANNFIVFEDVEVTELDKRQFTLSDVGGEGMDDGTLRRLMVNDEGNVFYGGKWFKTMKVMPSWYMDPEDREVFQVVLSLPDSVPAIGWDKFWEIREADNSRAVRAIMDGGDPDEDEDSDS